MKLYYYFFQALVPEQFLSLYINKAVVLVYGRNHTFYGIGSNAPTMARYPQKEYTSLNEIICLLNYLYSIV